MTLTKIDLCQPPTPSDHLRGDPVTSPPMVDSSPEKFIPALISIIIFQFHMAIFLLSIIIPDGSINSLHRLCAESIFSASRSSLSIMHMQVSVWSRKVRARWTSWTRLAAAVCTRSAII